VKAVSDATRDDLAQAAAALNSRPAELVARIAALQDESKKLSRRAAASQDEGRFRRIGSGAGAQADVMTSPASNSLRARCPASTRTACARSSISIAARSRAAVVVLASPSDGKVSIVVGVTPDLTKRVPAGQVVKQLAPIVGGGGGGRPDFAEAGGKDASKIGEMLAASRGVVEKLLSA
jgi:alanyl-tRNA synthetase